MKLKIDIYRATLYITVYVVIIVVSTILSGCRPVVKMDVLVQMMSDQEKYFRDEVIPSFEKEHRTDIKVISYGTVDSIESAMRRYANTAGLVKVPFDQSRLLMAGNNLIPLDSVMPESELKTFRNEYLLTSLGIFNGKNYLIPRKFETRIMVYSRSKVMDAVASWRKYVGEIDSVLIIYNGYGLPATYLLEENPDQWDYYDIFVVGWIWAHSLYNSELKPRIAHTGQRSSQTALRIIDRVFQMNGDSSSVMSIHGDQVVDAIHWEAVYASAGIYNPGMWEYSWSGEDIWRAFNSGDVFLSFMTQLDCFILHGTGRDNLVGYFKDPSDMGVATIPQGGSVELDATGIPSRMGKKSITTDGWWWAIPKGSPDPRSSLELATHITSATSQIQECSRFGMIPVRKDILGDMTMLFGGGWISEVYDVSFRQLMNNGQTSIPSSEHYGQISNVYLDMWYDIVVNKNWSIETTIPSRNFIRDRIESVYSLAADKINGNAR